MHLIINLKRNFYWVCHPTLVTASSDCQERLDFGGKAGGRESSWLVNSIGLTISSYPAGILGGIGGGVRRNPLLGSLGGMGGAASLSWERCGNLSNVTDFGGTRGALGIFIDNCRRTGDVPYSVELSGPFTDAARGFLGGMCGGGGSFSGKFSMLT